MTDFSNANDLAPKPYEMVSFPKESPKLARPIGHDRYQRDRLHGTLYLTLQVQTALHVSTGVTEMGSDLGSRLPLIKTMTTTDRQLVIQGSSLKGCIRSAYEAVTNSTLAVITSRYRDKIPSDRLPCRDREKLCPASRVFGAMDWQGLVEFNDSKCEKNELSVGFMPSLYSPRSECRTYFIGSRVAGRKFYYNMTSVINKGESRGIPAQQASRQYKFKTVIQYKNLLPEELGIVLLILGQDTQFPIALKVGGGKPIGMGTMTAEVRAIAQSQDVQNRYREYEIPHAQIIGAEMQTFIEAQMTAAHQSELLETVQWQQLATILKYPGVHEPREGMY
jgi:CRISPR/Cas system CSM-associated protein Csm3 (group 7 of RAMP superfamily)